MSDSLLPDYSAEDLFNQALEHLDQSDYSAVVACCDQAIALNPNYSDAWFVKGQVLQRMEEYEAALESFDRVVVLEPEVYQVWELHSYALIDLNRVEAALASIDRAIALMPADNPNWLLYYYRGQWLCQLEQIHEGIVSFEQAAAIVSVTGSANADELSEFWSTLGYRYAMAEQYEQAVAAFENAPFVSVEETDETWLYALLQLGRQDEILARYDQLVEAEPDSDMAWERRGLAMEKLGRLEEAIDSYKRVIALNPGSTIWYPLRQALEQLGRETEILDCHADVLALYPDCADFWAEQANSLNRLGRNEEALSSYEQAIRLGIRGEYADYTWHAYSILLNEFGRTEEAIEAWRQAATMASAIEPPVKRATDYWCDLGNFLFGMERYEEAIEYYDSSPFLYCDTISNYIQALTALGRLNDFVMQSNPSFADRPNPQEMWFKRGSILEQLEELEAALDSYKQGLAIDPTHWHTLYSCSNLLIRLKRYEEAIAVLDRLINVESATSPDPLYAKARCYAYLGQVDAALENLQKVIEIHEMYRRKAAVNEAFEKLHENERFKQLINE